MERDKPKQSESVGQTLPQLPWKQKRGEFNFLLFLSSNFMKLCRNIHRSVWQLLRCWKKFKMAAVAMVAKVQKMLNSLLTADPFETWHKNRSALKVVLFVFKIFKMAANIKIKKIVKNSKMKRFQWKWIFTGNKTCCTILRPFRFAMAAILNPRWPPKYKNPPIWAKFGFQVDYDVANLYPKVLVLFVWGTFVTLCVTVTNIFIEISSHLSNWVNINNYV